MRSNVRVSGECRARGGFQRRRREGASEAFQRKGPGPRQPRGARSLPSITSPWRKLGRLNVGCKNVANTTHRLDEVRIGGVLLELLAQPCDQAVDHAIKRRPRLSL